MKIAVSSQGPTLESAVDPRFGRAAYFIIFDTHDESFEAVANTDNAAAAQGAGVQSAQTVAKRRVDLVVSGNIGPKAFEGLRAAGIAMVSFGGGTVEEAIKQAREGRLTSRDSANVGGHWS